MDTIQTIACYSLAIGGLVTLFMAGCLTGAAWVLIKQDNERNYDD